MWHNNATTIPLFSRELAISRRNIPCRIWHRVAKGATPTFLLLYLKFYTLWRADFCYCFIVCVPKRGVCFARLRTVIWISVGVSARTAHAAPPREKLRVEGAVHEAGELHQQRKLCARSEYIYCVSSHLLRCLLSTSTFLVFCWMLLNVLPQNGNYSSLSVGRL